MTTTSGRDAATARSARFLAATAAAAAIVSPFAASARTTTEHLVAVSKTAMAITGNLVLHEERGAARTVVFDNGTTMKLAGGNDGVYRVLAFGNPVMLNGNRICDKSPVTRLAITEGRDGTYTIAAYSGRTMTEKTLCATFGYTTK